MVQNTCKLAKLGSSSNIPIYGFFRKIHHHVEISCIAGIFQTNGEGYPMAQKVSKKTKQNNNSKQTSIEEEKLSSRKTVTNIRHQTGGKIIDSKVPTGSFQEGYHQSPS